MDALLVVPAPMKALNEERPHRNFKGVMTGGLLP
jgi:hypothetical protein